MLPFDILAADNHVYSFEPAFLLPRCERFLENSPQNAWEHAMLYVQENDPSTCSSACANAYGGPDVSIILRYCAAYVLLSKRSRLLSPERLDEWYMLLDDWVSPLLPSHSLGWWRTAYGIEWLHARAMQAAPIDNIWFAGHYWPTLWSATNICTPPNSVIGHNIERWSFLADQWHIQHWLCENISNDTWRATYTSQIASPVSVHRALSRTLLLDEKNRHTAWQSIPAHIRAYSLLDWTLHAPDNDHRVLPYVCHSLGVDLHDLGFRLDLARTLNTSARNILDSLAMDNTTWPLPEDSDI